MEFEKHKDFLRYEKTARNLFLYLVQEIASRPTRNVWNRLRYLEFTMDEVAGVPEDSIKILRQAIEATKNLFGTYEHDIGGQKIPVIEDDSYEDAVRMILMMLEEIEK